MCSMLYIRVTSSVFLMLLMKVTLLIPLANAQDTYQYGTVIGSENDNQNIRSFLQRNEEGIRVTLIQSSGSFSNIRNNGIGGGGGNQNNGRNQMVQLFNVPQDTDYLELLVFNARINPRFIRKNKIQIIRVEDSGPPPFKSENLERYWTSYNFKDDYKEGGPFPLLEPGDIVIVQRKGFFNRPFFDPLTDLSFLITLTSLTVSVAAISNAL